MKNEWKDSTLTKISLFKVQNNKGIHEVVWDKNL